jgi:hypothetical protein
MPLESLLGIVKSLYCILLAQISIPLVAVVSKPKYAPAVDGEVDLLVLVKLI